jgi:hypothetical protein
MIPREKEIIAKWKLNTQAALLLKRGGWFGCSAAEPTPNALAD